MNTTSSGVRHDDVVRVDEGWASAASYWRPHHVVESAWLEHAPFAFWLVDAARPGVLAELGTHNGYSFFAFCEGAMRLGSGTRVFAIDTWRGDDHAGYYEEGIYQDVLAMSSARYPNSTLLRGLFDDHVDSFEDGSIDILHIDGRHGYEDVAHDFASWLPKVSSSGTVLFHDIAVRERGFGVWRFWDEISKRFPSFSFEHGHGLGVLATGDAIPAALQPLYNATGVEVDRIREFYSRLGADISADYARRVEVAAVAERVEGLESALADTRAELALVLDSFAWRATRPLRAVTGVLPAGIRKRAHPAP